MAEVRLRDGAKADIREIWDYTCEHWSRLQANAYVEALFDTMDELAADPTRGRNADNLMPNLRRQSYGSHVIYFLPASFGVDVVRILHGRMNALLHIANES